MARPEDQSELLEQALLTPVDDVGGCGEPQCAETAPAGTRYHQQYLHMAAWLAVLATGYAEQRAACQLGLPLDGLRQIDYLEFFTDTSCILLYGTVLGWLVGVTTPHRFAWLASPRRWYLWLTFLATPPVYSAISNIKPLKHDMAHLSTWGLPFIVVWILGMAAIAGVVGWHVWVAARDRPRADAAAYLASRLLLLAFLGGSAAVLAAQGVGVHLHHLYLGWALALWAELDRPLSGLTLAVGAGIFVQGVGAYSFAPVFSESCFTSPSAAAFSCKFWSDSPFTRLVQAIRSDGAVDVAVQSSFIDYRDLVPSALLSGGIGWMLYRAGVALELAVPLAAAGAALILLLQALLEVTSESVVYTPGQGAVLTARRRLGPKPPPRVLPLARLEGLVLEKAPVGGTQQTVLAYALKPAASKSGGGKGGKKPAEEAFQEAELLFPNLQPPLVLLRAARDVLGPLLDADLAGDGASGAQRSRRAAAATAAPRSEGMKKDK